MRMGEHNAGAALDDLLLLVAELDHVGVCLVLEPDVEHAQGSALRLELAHVHQLLAQEENFCCCCSRSLVHQKLHRPDTVRDVQVVHVLPVQQSQEGHWRCPVQLGKS
eukprot:466440-Hanusia_phi.AAC.4